MMTVHLDGVRFGWPDRAPIFDNLQLHVPRGLTGLVGENGAGKSTLLGLIAGELAPQAGRVRRPPGARTTLVPQRVEVAGLALAELAAREDRLACRLRGQLRLDPRQLASPGWDALSGGERRRWQLGAAMAEAPDVLLLDEPSAHLDAEGRALLIDALKSYPGTGLLVSHDRALLDALTTRTLRLMGGEIQSYELPYSGARAAWEAARQAELESDARLASEVRRARRALQGARETRASAERGRSNRHVDPADHDARSMGRKNLATWGEAAAARTVARRRTELDEIEARRSAQPIEPELGAALTVGWRPCPRPILASVQGDVRVGETVLLRGVDLAIGRRDRVWLTGPNGVGKSTLLRALQPGGEVLVLPQLLGLEDVRADQAALRALPPETRGRVLQVVAALGCPPARLLDTPLPSPGEARKLRLALGLGGHAWGLFLDEPEGELDLPSVERLEAALAAFPGAIVLVTHDRRLAEAVGAWEVDVGRWR